MFARLRARLAQEDGMTLIELLTTMSILGLVLTAILAMFVSGLGAETDMNNRFQAQQNARLALSSLRNEIGSACSVSVGTVTGETAGSQLTLVLPNPSPNPDVNANACAVGTSSAIWCAASASHAAPFGLYRSTAATCSSSSGVLRAGSLKCAGTAAGCTPVFSRNTPSSTTLPTVTVTFPVEANLTNTHGLYTLSDTITDRNAGVGT